MTVTVPQQCAGAHLGLRFSDSLRYPHRRTLEILVDYLGGYHGACGLSAFQTLNALIPLVQHRENGWLPAPQKRRGRTGGEGGWGCLEVDGHVRCQRARTDVVG